MGGDSREKVGGAAMVGEGCVGVDWVELLIPAVDYEKN